MSQRPRGKMGKSKGKGGSEPEGTGKGITGVTAGMAGDSRFNKRRTSTDPARPRA